MEVKSSYYTISLNLKWRLTPSITPTPEDFPSQRRPLNVVSVTLLEASAMATKKPRFSQLKLSPQKLSWSTIREAFEGEWVELSNVSWSSSGHNPRSAIVRNHHRSRATLLRAMRSCGSSQLTSLEQSVTLSSTHQSESVVIYVDPASASLPSISYAISAGFESDFA